MTDNDLLWALLVVCTIQLLVLVFAAGAIQGTLERLIKTLGRKIDDIGFGG